MRAELELTLSQHRQQAAAAQAQLQQQLATALVRVDTLQARGTPSQLSCCIHLGFLHASSPRDRLRIEPKVGGATGL